MLAICCSQPPLLIVPNNPRSRIPQEKTQSMQCPLDFLCFYICPLRELDLDNLFDFQDLAAISDAILRMWLIIRSRSSSSVFPKEIPTEEAREVQAWLGQSNKPRFDWALSPRSKQDLKSPDPSPLKAGPSREFPSPKPNFLSLQLGPLRADPSRGWLGLIHN